MSFDAYYQWLGIPPREQPPNHYRLLGLELFESNEDVISNAADRQMVHLRSFQTSKRASHSQRLLNEVAAARICLLDPKKRAAYDEQLRKTLPAGTAGEAPPAPPPLPPPPPVSMPTSAANATSNAAATVEGGERPVSALLVSAPPGKPMVVSVAEQSQDVAVTGVSVGLRTGSAATRPRLRRRKSAIGELAKIVAGGVFGSCLGIAILWYGFGIDLLGLRETVPKEWLQAAGIPPVGEGPHDPSTTPTPPTGTDEGTPSPASVAGTNGDSRKPATVEPKTKRSNGSEQGNQPTPIAADRDNESPPPRAPSVISSKPNRPRVAPPSAAEQAKALAVLEAVHRPDTARTRTAKRELAEKLIRAAEDPTANDVERFVVLKKAAELAEEAGAPRIVMQVVERMEQAYEIDGTSAREKLLIRTAPNVADESPLEEFVQASQAVVTELVRLDRLDEALRLTDATYEACLKPHGKKQRKYVYDGRNGLRKLHQRWVEANAARRAIESGDNDATNFSTLGQFLCVYHEDWDAGLDFLTRAPEAMLRAAAEADLAKPNSAADRVMAGDLWYDVAKSNPAFEGFAARAIHWYELAEPQVTGLVRTKTTMRLEEMRNKLRDFDSREMSIGGLNRRKT